MNKFKITLGATTLIMVAVAIVACSKEKEQQQQTPAVQQTAEPHDYTLAEMAEAMSWEEGKAFFENQPIKDYTAVCEKVMSECGFEEKTAGFPYSIDWQWKQFGGNCDSNFSGLCLVVKRKENSSADANAMGYYEDGKLVITQEPNAANPVQKGLNPLLTFDVWEHAYYLDYQNRRPDHLAALWQIMDWDVISKRYGK